MATRELEITTAILAKAPADSRVDLAWEVVKKFARGLALSNQAPAANGSGPRPTHAPT